MANLALADLVSPYLLRGDNLGAYHAALSVIRVTTYSLATSDDGIAIRGRAELNGQGLVDVSQGRLLIAGSTSEATPPFDPQRRSPVFDLAETSLDFEIFVPRDGSLIIGQGEGTIVAAGFAQTKAVLDVWGTLPVQPAPSDYPSSGFTLDLIVNAPSIRPPFLHPAKMNDRGLLEPDSSVQEVSLSLPRLRFRLAHGNPVGSQLRFDIVSFGAEGLDDPGDVGEAELIAMTPPYAFIGGPSDRVVGIGFRKAVLDLSSNATPPEVISKFGFGDDWSGLYLPEVRIFVAPHGAQDLAIEAGVQDLLIGFGATHGVSGDFELAVIDQGHGDLTLSARFFDADGHAYGIDRTSPTTATVILPALTRLVIDIQGGLPPYTTSLNGAASSRLYNIDLSGNAQQALVITGHDSTGGTPKTALLTIQAQRRTAQAMLPAPGGGASPTQKATPDPAVTDPQIVIAFQTDTDVTLTTDPQTAQVMWSITNPPAGGETGPQATFSVPLATGETKTVRARLPGTTVPSELFYYFYFDEPARVQNPQQENSLLGAYADGSDNISTAKALTPLRADGREPGAAPAFGDPRKQLFDTVVPPGTALKVYGEASFEADASDAKLDYNYKLARRRAIAVREALASHHAARGFTFTIDPEPSNMADYPGPNARFGSLSAWKSNWVSHGDPNRRDWWSVSLELPPGLSQPEKHGDRAVTRPSVPPPPGPVIPVVDPPAPNPPDPPSWFRSAKLKARIVQDVLVAVEVDLEVDFQTAAEQQLSSTGQIPGGATPTQGQTLQNGSPLGPDNPADGITKFELLVQSDQATGKITTMIQIGADPADKDGLLAFGWLPGQAMPPNKDLWLTLAGSYISFWPMLVDFSTGNRGGAVDAALTGAALAIPGAVAVIPWFRVERVILFGGEYLQRDNPSGEIEVYLLFDVEADWSADISIGGMNLITIDRQFPLAVRYKAIGIRLGNRDDAQTPKFTLKPVFDASRGFTIDVARGGSIKVAPPFDKILKILAARLSRTNPLTFEVDIGCAVDLGVVSIDRVRLRVFLETPIRPPELTAFGASIDVPGALAGRGYLEIGPGDQPDTSKMGGQIDVTVRPISLRVAAAFEMQDIIDPNNAAHHATAVYIGLNIVLPVGIPLGTSGLGIFGFRGIFGMHYMRNDQLGGNTAAPALGWLQATEGQPHLIQSPTQHNILWKPKLDDWAFGVGILLGTMEGGVILNLDGTLLLELPGPRVAIVMNARIISPPPSLEGMGSSGGILAIIEITPDHFLVGVLIDYDIASLIKINIPVEAFFSFTDASDWHFYLGQRAAPVSVTVLDIIKATGYLMITGKGLGPLPQKHLPAVVGFGIGAGAAASFTWGDTGVGLYLRIAGSFDAVMGFDPFLLAGEFELTGELRLFIISIGASAELDILVVGQTGSYKTHIHGQACGHVDFFFFSIEGCVDVTLGSPNAKPGIPNLVEKLSIKSRSPALLVGTGVDRPIDTSLGKGIEQDTPPSMANKDLPIVPIDSVLVVGLALPPAATGLTFMGAPVTGSTGQAPGSPVSRGSERYTYTLTAVTLERADGGPPLLGSNAPATWWTPADASSANVNAQLALLTYEPDPATKAFEKTEQRTEQIRQRWQRACEDAAPPTRVLWTFLDERLGPSPTGWDLEGIAWPDPPNTRRKEPPPTAMHVSERWRCGDAKIDALRGIIPAMVLGALIKCQQQTLPPRTVNAAGVMSALRRVAFDPILARRVETLEAAQATPQLQRVANLAQAGASVRLLEKASRVETIPAGALDPVTVAGKLAGGMAVSRLEIAAAFLAPAAGASATTGVGAGQLCQTRVLESPIFDDGRLIVFGNAQRDSKRVAEALKQAGVTHGPLNDVVVLNTGAFVDATILLFVRRQFFEGKLLVVRTLRKDGSELSRVAVTIADRVATKPLPAHWTDPSGPWAIDVQDVLGWKQDPRASGYEPAWVLAKGGVKSDRIEIGILDQATSDADRSRIAASMGVIPPYFLGAFDALEQSEVVRADSEQTEITNERKVLTQILGPGPTDDAYLVPGQLYKVTATWSGKRESDSASDGKTQTFWFAADNTPPPHLDPWVLLTTPSDKETHAFRLDAVQIVFNTHNVDRLFAAYGKELRVRFTASTANHPKPTPSVPHPFALVNASIKPAGAAILSPWEDALQEVAQQGLPCIPVDINRDRLSITTIPILLDPYTDYYLDVIMVDVGAPDNADGPRIYRRGFSTGSYDTLQHFAADMQSVKVTHRALDVGKLDAVRTFFAGRRPQGAELDEQLRQAGVEASNKAPGARILVLWEQAGGGAPQPVGLLVDAPEPLWRTRPHPQKITDSTGLSNAQRWAMGSRDWLEVQTGATTDAPIAANGVIRAPGDQRVLVVLAAGARGKRLTLDLVRTASPPEDTYLPIPEERHAIVDLTLATAPWEE